MDGMLRSMSGALFREWRLYEELEPFPAERADLNAAHIVQFLWRLGGDPDNRWPNGRPLSDFILRFGDARSTEVKQSVETQEMLLDAWIFGSNAAFTAAAQKAN